MPSFRKMRPISNTLSKPPTCKMPQTLMSSTFNCDSDICRIQAPLSGRMQLPFDWHLQFFERQPRPALSHKIQFPTNRIPIETPSLKMCDMFLPALANYMFWPVSNPVITQLWTMGIHKSQEVKTHHYWHPQQWKFSNKILLLLTSQL